MSILIKGMDMPKNCYGCLFFKQVDYWNKDDEADILSKCKRTGEFTWESVNGYLPNCPLAHFQPHGRLIDADALMHEFEKAQRTMEQHGQEYSCSFMSSSQELSTEWYCVEDMLENAPTIIPAEEGET